MKNSIKSMFYPVLLTGASFLSPQSADAQAPKAGADKQAAHDLAWYQAQLAKEGYVADPSKVTGPVAFVAGKSVRGDNGNLVVSTVTINGVNKNEITNVNLVTTARDGAGNMLSVRIDLRDEVRMSTEYRAAGNPTTLRQVEGFETGENEKGEETVERFGDSDSAFEVKNCQTLTGKSYREVKDTIFGSFLRTAVDFSTLKLATIPPKPICLRN